MAWKFQQAFGDKGSLEKASEEDFISALTFNRDGSKFAVGDNSGRLILFEKGPDSETFEYLTELQSHVQDFDPLKSKVIEERLVGISWLRARDKADFLLSTNRNCIKLWKLACKQIKKVVKPSSKDLALPRLQVVEEGIVPNMINSFPNLHSGHIHSISPSCNEEYLLSGDESSLLLWNLDRPKEAFQLAQLNHDRSADDKAESFTVSKFAADSDCLVYYGTSFGRSVIVDMRTRSSRLTSQALGNDKSADRPRPQKLLLRAHRHGAGRPVLQQQRGGGAGGAEDGALGRAQAECAGAGVPGVGVAEEQAVLDVRERLPEPKVQRAGQQDGHFNRQLQFQFQHDPARGRVEPDAGAEFREEGAAPAAGGGQARGRRQTVLEAARRAAEARPRAVHLRDHLPKLHIRLLETELTRHHPLLSGSEHPLHDLVYQVLAVAPVAAPHERVPLGREPAPGVAQLERPQRVVGHLEVGSDRGDLVDQVLDALELGLALEGLVDDEVGGDGDALAVDLQEAPLVDQLADGRHRGVAVHDERLHLPQQVHRRLVHPHEHRVVDLPQPQQPQDPDHSRRVLVNTPDPHHQRHLLLPRHVDGPLQLRLALGRHLRLVELAVLLFVGLAPLGGLLLDFLLEGLPLLESPFDEGSSLGLAGVPQLLQLRDRGRVLFGCHQQRMRFVEVDRWESTADENGSTAGVVEARESHRDGLERGESPEVQVEVHVVHLPQQQHVLLLLPLGQNEVLHRRHLHPAHEVQHEAADYLVPSRLLAHEGAPFQPRHLHYQLARALHHVRHIRYPQRRLILSRLEQGVFSLILVLQLAQVPITFGAELSLFQREVIVRLEGYLFFGSENKLAGLFQCEPELRREQVEPAPVPLQHTLHLLQPAQVPYSYLFAVAAELGQVANLLHQPLLVWLGILGRCLKFIKLKNVLLWMQHFFFFLRFALLFLALVLFLPPLLSLSAWPLLDLILLKGLLDRKSISEGSWDLEHVGLPLQLKQLVFDIQTLVG